MPKFCSHHNRLQVQYNLRNNGIPDHVTVSYECPFTQDTSRWEILAIHTVGFQHRAVWYTSVFTREYGPYLQGTLEAAGSCRTLVPPTIQNRHTADVGHTFYYPLTAELSYFIIVIICHYNALWVFAFSAKSLQVLLFLAASFQFLTFSFFRSSMTSSCHRCLDFPTGLVPIGFQSSSFPVGLAWSILWICPSHLILCALTL